MSYKFNVTVLTPEVQKHMQEQAREHNAPEVKGPLPFFLEPVSQFLKVLFTMGQSFNHVPTGSYRHY